MTYKLLSIVLMCGLVACGAKTKSDIDIDATIPTVASEEAVPVPVSTKDIVTDDEDVSFADVLAQFQDLNTRLDNVSYQLRRKNQDLCPEITRSPGMTAHTVTDYPENLQEIARELLPVHDYVSVRTVWAGSPAATAGLKPGDRILSVGGHYLATGRTSKHMYEAVLRRSVRPDIMDISLLRAGERLDRQIYPENLCGYKTHVLYSEQVNAITDGQKILLTSELIRRIDNDHLLALYVAHEMAHAIQGHTNQAPTIELELEADTIGLSLIARAGFDVEVAISTWKAMPHPHVPESSTTHPSIDVRHDNMRRVQSQIEATQTRGEALGLMP